MEVTSTAPEVHPVVEARASEVQILDAGSVEEYQAWVDLWWDWPARDVMAHPDYVRLFARPDDRVFAAVQRTQKGGILYPFLLRPLETEPWAAGQVRGCDLTTPYGYGGPFAWGASAEEADLFWKRFDAWAAGQRVATSFSRLSLFADQRLPFNGQILQNGPNVVRPVRLSNEALWNDYRGEARKYITRARECGVRIVFDPAGKSLDDFLAIYKATMDRRNATQNYYFPRSFFERFVQTLAGHFTFVHAIMGRQILSSEILLFSQNHAYSYLGGTLTEGFPVGANYLLKNESFKYCRDMGIQSVVLGGGYQPNDGILRYKRHFGSSCEVPFLLGLKTYDADQVQRLTELRREWEQARGRTWAPAPAYFPPYRS